MDKPLRELLIERMKSGDPWLNYCHWPYEPPASGNGKLRPSVLLFKAVNEMPHAAWVTKILQAIQRGSIRLPRFQCFEAWNLGRIATRT